jgi:hypothetical protein
MDEKKNRLHAITNKVMALRGGQAFQIPKEAGREVWNTA